MQPRSALLIGAHPDDWALGAFGTALQLVERGWKVTCLTLTSGELGGDKIVREREDGEAAKLIGAELQIGTLPDCGVNEHSATELIRDTIRSTGASIVFGHHFADHHRDHAVAAKSIVAACRKVPSLLFYDGPSVTKFDPSFFIDITMEWQRKQIGLKNYSSQHARLDICGWSDNASRFRAWPYLHGKRVEAFVPHHVNLSTLASLELSIPHVY